MEQIKVDKKLKKEIIEILDKSFRDPTVRSKLKEIVLKIRQKIEEEEKVDRTN